MGHERYIKKSHQLLLMIRVRMIILRTQTMDLEPLIIAQKIPAIVQKVLATVHKIIKLQKPVTCLVLQAIR